MYSVLKNFQCLPTNVPFSRFMSLKTCRNFLKSNENVQKLFCRRKAITTREEFLKMRKVHIKEVQAKQNNSVQISPLGYGLLAVPVLTFCLGTWQVQRLSWKTNLINNLNERLSMPAMALPENLQELQNMEYRRVKVKGHFIHEKEFTVGPKSLILQGKPASESKNASFSPGDMSRGYLVITPFKLEDRDITILVNRGWVPARQKNPTKRKEAQIEDTIELTGIVRLNEDRPQFVAKNNPEKQMWLYRDIYAMAKMTGSEPVYIDAVYESTVPGGPIGGQTRVVVRNEHLSYIVTWYSLSAITGWMYYKQYIKKIPLF